MLNGPCSVVELEAVDDRAGLGDADLEVVERGVVVDVGAVADQAVVGEHLDAGVGGLLEGVGEGGAVDGGDHEDLGALGDHVLDLRELGRDVVLGVLEVGRVADAPCRALTRLSPSAIQRAEDLVGIAMPTRPLPAALLGRRPRPGPRRPGPRAPGPRWPGPRWPGPWWRCCRRTRRRRGRRPRGPLQGTSSSVRCAPPGAGPGPRGLASRDRPAAGGCAACPLWSLRRLQVDLGWTLAVIVPVNDNGRMLGA